MCGCVSPEWGLLGAVRSAVWLLKLQELPHLVAAAVSLAAEVAVFNCTLLCQWLPCVVKVAATVTMAT